MSVSNKRGPFLQFMATCDTCGSEHTATVPSRSIASIVVGARNSGASVFVHDHGDYYRKIDSPESVDDIRAAYDRSMAGEER